MPRRDNSAGSGRKKPAGRSGARSNSSRSDSPRGVRSSRGGDFKKPFKSTRGDSKDFSKPRRSYDRKDESSDKPARGGNFRKRSEGEKPFTRSREDRTDSKRPSRYSKDDSKDFSKPRRSYDRKDDSSERPSREGNFKRRSEGGFISREEKPFKRSREEGETKRPAGHDRGDSKRFKFSDKEDRDDKKSGFFSKLSRGGKSFTRKAAPAPEYGPKIEKAKEDLGSDKIRLNRYISNSGICSRREADELIKMGLVSVNGTVVTEMGHKVSRKDVIKYDGKTLRAEKPVYILMNKPKGFLTTTKDPQDRNTVMQIIAESVKERVYPVGRLDRNTTGLLLLTNDGELADKLMHPSYNVKKIYKVDLDKPLAKADFEKIKKGVHLEEGKVVVDDLALVSDDGKTVGIELHIGWNRVIRRIFESLGYEVVKLDRSVYAGLDKKDLSRGHWRHLTREEVVRLKHYQ
ncbi:MAG TPA: pseudouridine synthase [Cyclobacteriaceae bacterium]|nr:pseudouridine synthase [Cyclobacteriaceae bacterium]